MSTVPARIIEVTLPTRSLNGLWATRDLEGSVISRNLVGTMSSRDFGGDDTLAWRVWGQTDIHPFDSPTGVDSTKTMEDLP